MNLRPRWGKVCLCNRVWKARQITRCAVTHSNREVFFSRVSLSLKLILDLVKRVNFLFSKMVQTKVVFDNNAYYHTYEYKALQELKRHMFEGSRVMVVKGEKNLRTCGLLDHKKEGYTQTHMAPGQPQVRVTFETNAQEIGPQSPTVKRTIHTTTERGQDEQYEGENASNENLGSDNLTMLAQLAQDFLNRHFISEAILPNETDPSNLNSSLEVSTPHHLRHEKQKMQELEASERKKNQRHNKKQKKHLRRKNKKNESAEVETNSSLPLKSSELKGNVRSRRSVHLSQTHLLDGGIEHGGNAANGTIPENDAESSFSSFENSLRTCYEGQILLNEEFPPSHNCTDVSALEIQGTMEAIHEVSEDGYYYYIFYSDNDYVSNDIHAIFNIHKPTYQYAKHARSCFNETECSFPITFWSDETVIVEIPTRDGIEHEEDDITYLISTCHPRMSVYVIFPVAVLFLILGCAFM
ncbi:hypothetical protein C0J52_14509 [Blattella germanica]|nr:hypothetical protein C0J52_14509 [Blattella germanica]